MRVVFGGTFDPVHIGHLRMAVELAELLSLDRVYLMPCFDAVHKDGVCASSSQRKKMLQLSVAQNPVLALDDRELRRQTPSFTIDSLTEIRAEIGAEPLVFVMGADSVQGFESWKRVSEFSGLTHLVIIQRPGSELTAQKSVFEDLGFIEATDQAELRHSPAGKVFRLRLNLLEISSTSIRSCVNNKSSIRYLVTDAVERYICDNGLYKANVGSDS